MIEIVTVPIENSTLLPAQSDPSCGATVLFLGTVREFTESEGRKRQTACLHYEAFIEMAYAALEDLCQKVKSRWPVQRLRVIHRIGPIELGETCVAILTSCPHRKDAFAAASWLMDQIKAEVPLWKKEIWVEGTSQWIHPESSPSTAKAKSSTVYSKPKANG